MFIELPCRFHHIYWNRNFTDAVCLLNLCWTLGDFHSKTESVSLSLSLYSYLRYCVDSRPQTTAWYRNCSQGYLSYLLFHITYSEQSCLAGLYYFRVKLCKSFFIALNILFIFNLKCLINTTFPFPRNAFHCTIQSSNIKKNSKA